MTAISIKSIIEQSQKSLAVEINERKLKRPYYNLSTDEFKELLILECNRVLVARNCKPDFVIDKINSDIFILLLEYIQGDPKNMDPSKGIILGGSIGSGKTVLLKGFCNIITSLGDKIITNIHAMKLQSLIQEKGITTEMIKRPLFIDDLGKEEEMVKSFGTNIKPLIELIAMRYDEGSWTFATTNYKTETLMQKYTPHTADRIKEMFNYRILEGGSRRK